MNSMILRQWHTGLICWGLVITVLGGCVSYQTQTNKALGYSEHIERLFVWSAIGNVSSLRAKHKYADDSYENYANAALKKAMSETGLTVDVRSFNPQTDTVDLLSRYETEVAPTARLTLVPGKYQVTTYRGISTVSTLWLNLSLYDIQSNRSVWHGQIVIDNGGLAGHNMMWNKSGAEKLAEEIITALRKDGLIASAPRASSSNSQR